jgi:hypothetical protein
MYWGFLTTKKLMPRTDSSRTSSTKSKKSWVTSVTAIELMIILTKGTQNSRSSCAGGSLFVAVGAISTLNVPRQPNRKSGLPCLRHQKICWSIVWCLGRIRSGPGVITAQLKYPNKSLTFKKSMISYWTTTNQSNSPFRNIMIFHLSTRPIKLKNKQNVELINLRQRNSRLVVLIQIGSSMHVASASSVIIFTVVKNFRQTVLTPIGDYTRAQFARLATWKYSVKKESTDPSDPIRDHNSAYNPN